VPVHFADAFFSLGFIGKAPVKALCHGEEGNLNFLEFCVGKARRVSRAGIGSAKWACTVGVLFPPAISIRVLLQMCNAWRAKNVLIHFAGV